MAANPEYQAAVEAWSCLFQVLADKHRRQIIYRLMGVPQDRPLPLPDAAMIPHDPIDVDRLMIALQHDHLPKMTDAGYVCWAGEPFEVRQGPRFDEPSMAMRVLRDSLDEMPSTLWNELVAEAIMEP